MKTGLLKPTFDKRDFDFHKTFGSVLPPSFPTEYSVDAGLWNPNQNNANALDGLDTIPPLPMGCTDYTQTDLCIDEDDKLYSPMLLENETHANARGGIDIRESLKAAIKIFSRTAYFSIRAQAPLDMFDAIRLAMLSTASEKRGVSAGTPFFGEWLNTPDGILPIPVFDLSKASWHNWKIAGWKMIGDQPYLVCKMWTGDWKYMSRPLCNALFGINFTIAYTLSKFAPADVQTVDFNIVQWIVSFFRNLLPQSAPIVPPVPVSTPAPTPTASIHDFCLGIRAYEGWAPDSRSWVNNNPGNCRYSSVGYSNIYKPVLKDRDNFAVFKNYDTGWLYLNNLIKLKAFAHPSWTILDLMKVYAPTGDANDPVKYAAFLRNHIGVDEQFKISQLS